MGCYRSIGNPGPNCIEDCSTAAGPTRGLDGHTVADTNPASATIDYTINSKDVEHGHTVDNMDPASPTIYYKLQGYWHLKLCIKQRYGSRLPAPWHRAAPARDAVFGRPGKMPKPWPRLRKSPPPRPARAHEKHMSLHNYVHEYI